MTFVSSLIHIKAKLADHCLERFYVKLEFPGRNGNASNRIIARIGKIDRPIFQTCDPI